MVTISTLGLQGNLGNFRLGCRTGRAALKSIPSQDSPNSQTAIFRRWSYGEKSSVVILHIEIDHSDRLPDPCGKALFEDVGWRHEQYAILTGPPLQPLGKPLTGKERVMELRFPQAHTPP
ncbi:MAG: hypothetical protein XD60_0710 [Acetothermia bacterium 64_32]|nr:MAG: hypothetical protein XD60_0710 [Acetothermia bacterium 64_32]